MNNSFLIFTLILLFSVSTFAQNVAINANGDAPHSSAALDIASTSGGLLIPRMTQVQRAAISTPANGLMVYQTDGSAGFYYYGGSSWEQVGSSPDAVLRTTSVASGNTTLSGTNDQSVICQGAGGYTITLPVSPAAGQIITLVCSVPTVTIDFPGKDFLLHGAVFSSNSLDAGSSVGFNMLIAIYDGANWAHIASF